MGLPGVMKKKKFIKIFYNKSIQFIKKIQNFFIFKKLIHEMNLIALESLKKIKRWLNSCFLCAK